LIPRRSPTVLVPAAILGFAVTLVLIPVALVLALLYAFAIVLGWVVSAALPGERLTRALKGTGWALAVQVGLGALVLAVLGNTPFIGGLIGFLAASLGLGALILTRLGTQAYAAAAPAAPSSTSNTPTSA